MWVEVYKIPLGRSHIKVGRAMQLISVILFPRADADWYRSYFAWEPNRVLVRDLALPHMGIGLYSH